ncbi:glycosyl hydrolase 53 family protein [Treponema zuelzerae]|uniref:Arabinogalactan endo-beta-1,4-galactanase n=1 Tax=Teretinema zuelzerae TaxID=156 RepID=A0AAE3EHL1_9SPIR|nr:glycosyl hydrolase 53 family protein [Teretinema zuelzerae]MCD1655145.1 glycosyl hydrolase 53 family protein [Teretinema zuelzerae]
MKHAIYALCIGAVAFAGCASSGVSSGNAAASLPVYSGNPEEGELFVEKIEGLPAAFLRGVDVSSVLALEKSGVVFRDKAGNPQDLFVTLRDSGVNSIRIRVWNNPFDDQGRGFGGGNCDIDAAIVMGRRAAAAGLPVLLDFHYSDFWADPAKQQAPRAWAGMDIDAKADALYEYTKTSLAKAVKAGVNVHMVQIGNETTGAMCGETNWINIAKLMKAGSKAVREVSAKEKKNIKIAVHFTNPEKSGEYERYVQILSKQNLDYDVFASSWYPWWHGSVDNFAAVLKRVAELSGKEVMCAEVSYAHTYENGDETGNTISEETMCEKPWPITVQGQASAVRETIAAVASVGKAGIGVYYWEPAWLPVPGETYDDQRLLWDRDGSGWASSYAYAYDPKDAGKYFGGSSWDNQAMFAFDGTPLASLDVWRLVYTGSVTDVRPDFVEEAKVRVRIGDKAAMPAEVWVVKNNGERVSMPVSWNASAKRLGSGPDAGKMFPLSTIGGAPLGDYLATGALEGASQDSPAPSALVSVVEPNYLDNPSFEDKDLSMWKIENVGGVTTELFVQEKLTDAKSGKNALHFWSKGKVSFRVEQTVRNLKPGVYKFSIALHGGDAKNQNMYIYAISGGKTRKAETDVDGWRNFRSPVIQEIQADGGPVTVGAYIGCDAGGWGSLDDFLLAPVR